jgi:hypothetical protein
MQMPEPVALWCGEEAACPVVAVAIHAGHALRDEVADLTAVPAERRFREEDPGTAEWAMSFPTRLVAGRSRFEVDLNRPRDSAVYLQPEDCWDLEPWRCRLQRHRRRRPGAEGVHPPLNCDGHHRTGV